MTDFKARARELAEKAWDEARTQDQAITAFECAMLQFGREVLQAEPTPEIFTGTWSHLLAHIEIYRAMAAVRAKELE